MAQLQRAESLGPPRRRARRTRALYGADPSAQAQANAWLLSFAGTAAAWDVGRQLYLEPEEEVQYFGANLLFTKVRGEWHGLADEAKASVYTGLLGLLQQLPAAGGGWRKLPPGAKRLCLALAAAAVRSTQAAERYVASALELAAASPAASLELLGGLPAELLAQEAALADGAMSPARPELRALLPRALDALQSAVGSMGHAALGGGGGGDTRAAAECSTACLRALQQWLALQAGGSLLLLGERYPQLVAAAFAALAVADDDLNAAAADAVVELLSASNTTLAPSNEKAHAAALHVAELLERHGGALALPTLNGAAGAAVDERSYHFCRAACAFAERAVDLIARARAAAGCSACPASSSAASPPRCASPSSPSSFGAGCRTRRSHSAPTTTPAPLPRAPTHHAGAGGAPIRLHRVGRRRRRRGRMAPLPRAGRLRGAAHLPAPPPHRGRWRRSGRSSRRPPAPTRRRGSGSRAPSSRRAASTSS